MAKKKPNPRRSKASAKYRIRETTTTYGPNGLPMADRRRLWRSVTQHIEPADPDEPEAIDVEELIRSSPEHPLDVLEGAARRVLEMDGFEPPASFIDRSPAPEPRARLGREVKKKLGQEIRARRAASRLGEFAVPRTDEGRRRMALLELARKPERTPAVLAAQTLVSVLSAKRHLARGEAWDATYHAVLAPMTWQSVRDRPWETDDWRNPMAHAAKSGHAGSLKSAARHARWEREATRLRAVHPEWGEDGIARTISELPIADGRSWRTIRDAIGRRRSKPAN